MKVANEQRRIEELIARAAGSGGQVRWAVDLVSPMASLLLAVLLTSGQDVVYVPGCAPGHPAPARHAPSAALVSVAATPPAPRQNLPLPAAIRT